MCNGFEDLNKTDLKNNRLTNSKRGIYDAIPRHRRKNLKAQLYFSATALRFSTDGKQFESGAFWKQWSHYSRDFPALVFLKQWLIQNDRF